MKIIPETSQLQGHSLTWYALILWIEAGAKSLNQELHTPSSGCLQDIQVWVFWLHLRSTRTNLNSDLDSWGCPAKPTQTLDSLPLWCSMPGTRLQVSAASSWAGSLAIPKVAASSGLNPMLYSRSLLFIYFIYCCCCSVTKSCQTLCDLMDCSMPGFPVHHQLLELAQTHVHQFSDAIQPSHPLSPPFPFALNLFQHHGLF